MTVICSDPSEDDRVATTVSRSEVWPLTSSIETGNPEVALRSMPGYYDVSFGRDVRVTAEHVLAISRSLPPPTGTVNLLIRCRGLTAVASSAVDSYSRFTSIARVAVLGEGPADRILTRFFSRSVVSAHESEYFEDEAEARAWLAGAV